MRRILTIAAALGLLLLGGLLAARLLRPAPSDAERIQALLASAAAAAEERRAGEVVRDVSDRFSGEGLDRQGLRQFVTYQILRGQWVAVTIAGTRLEVEGDVARAAVDVALARGGPGTRLADLLPAGGSVHRLQLRLEREPEGWKVVRARWRPVPVEQALDGPALEPEPPLSPAR